MFKRAILVLLPLATAAGPFALFSGPGWWSKLTSSWSSDTPTQASTMSVASLDARAKTESGEASPSAAASFGRAPVMNLEEALRFDITPRWVAGRWPRVSAGLGQLQLQGYRVPLVTGTRRDDVAGALTYYFNSRQQVERITLQGTTGDVRRLVHFLVSRFGFQRRLANDPGLVVYQTPGKKDRFCSCLHIKTAGIVRSNEPYRHYSVALRIERPRS
jgi:hypothetical protein